MNGIEELEQRLRSEFGDLAVRLERPKHPDGRYWLDLEVDGYLITTVWKLGEGFGMSSPDLETAFGDCESEESFQSVDAVFVRVVELVETLRSQKACHE